MPWDGDAYQRRLDDVAAAGGDVHGEAAFVRSLAPVSVLDAGCGTGRVAIELARHGIDVVGVDVDASMLATARGRAPHQRWVHADVADLDLGRTFEVVVMAGNVPLFSAAGTQRALVAGCARHLRPGGWLVAGFQLDGGYGTGDYDEDCREAGLVAARRWSSWERGPWPGDGRYAVSLHRMPAEPD